ncbi:hypothetical protein A4A49_16652 [Nicotiana attenuata]|uniref:Putative plant transposon protein domain-containing protein n=1 Tax=Nicotiana attenuata TaxID=49451 RepID=A0A1J6IGT5_NICAT|nr:hypothetical protein A4A49_16652 [Nicotiana attenuata]
MPPRKDTCKGKATSTAQAKAKATSAPPPKKKKGGEATSSMSGAQAEAAVAAMRPQPQAQREFGINSIPPHTRDWYRHYRPKHIHPEGAIQERNVKAKYPAIWQGIHDLGKLSYDFKNTGEINLNLVMEFYTGFDPEDSDELVPICGRLIDFSTKAICDFLGAPNVPVEPLDQFILQPTYRELRHTLCGVDSTTAWVRDKVTNRHKRFPKKKMKLEAQVWLKLLNARLLPCNHDMLISRERTCVLYFLMTGQRVNVGHLIRYQMASVRTSKRIDRMPFPNFLTRFLQNEGVEEEPDFDHSIDQLIRKTDIINLWLKGEAGAEHNARDDSFMAHLYGMMDLQLRIGGRPAISEERTELEQRYPLNAHA